MSSSSSAVYGRDSGGGSSTTVGFRGTVEISDGEGKRNSTSEVVVDVGVSLAVVGGVSISSCTDFRISEACVVSEAPYQGAAACLEAICFFQPLTL